MGHKKREKKSRRKEQLATAILLAVTAALNLIEAVLEKLLD